MSLLTELDVFFTDHHHCGDLDGGVTDRAVRFASKYGAMIRSSQDRRRRAASSGVGGGFDEREGTVKYIRIYSDPVGESHFEDVETQFNTVDFAPPAPPVQTAIPMPAEQVVLLTLPPGFYADWHPAPRRQLFLQLSGQIEVGVSDGETRRFGAGTVVLGEDLSGKGHTVRVLSTADALGAIVQLA